MATDISFRDKNKLAVDISSVLDVRYRHPCLLLLRPWMHHIAVFRDSPPCPPKQLIDLFKSLLFGLREKKVDHRKRHTEI